MVEREYTVKTLWRLLEQSGIQCVNQNIDFRLIHFCFGSRLLVSVCALAEENEIVVRNMGPE